MRPDYIQAVQDVVALIPAGSVLAYGDIAELLDSGGPRQVGAVLSRHGSSVPWWRVLRASGAAPPGHEREALVQYLAEGTPLAGEHAGFIRTGEGRWRVDLRSARWAPADRDFERIDSIADRLRAEARSEAR